MRFLLVFVLALSACARGVDYGTAAPQVVAAAVGVHNTNFDPKIGYAGPYVSGRKSHDLFGGSGHMSFYLRGWRDRRTGEATHQLYMEIEYRDSRWRFYSSANLQGGQYADLVEIDEEVFDCVVYSSLSTTCSFREVFGVSLSDRFLRDRADSGLAIRVNSRRGYHNFFTVPASYIQGYLSAVG